MALVTIPGALVIPQPIVAEAMYGGGGTINALNNLEATAFIVRKTGNLRRFECRFITVAAVMASGLRFSFQANAAGVNSGTPLSFVQSTAGTPAAAGWFNPGDFNVDIAVTKGDILWLVIDASTYTTGSAVPSVCDWPASGWGGYPYSLTDASRNGSGAINAALYYDDGTAEILTPGLWPAATHAAIAINTGTTPDEYGNAFQPNFPCRITGVWFQVLLSNQATAVFDLVIYDSGGGVLASMSRPASTGLDIGPSYWWWDLDTPVVLGANDLIRATILPTAAVNISVSNVVFSAAAVFNAADGGAMLYATQRTNAGGWTDFNNVTDGYRKARIGFMIDQLDDGTGGGGGGQSSSVSFG